MARAAVKAKQARQAKVQPAKTRARGRRRHAGGGNPNQQLFFVRMRRSAKPAYVVLAVLFAATFAFLGVGSGSSGLNQLFNGLNIFGHSGTSVSSALAEVRKHPSSAKAFRDLATAYESKNDTAQAISALQEYTTLSPKDVKAWTELANLQMNEAQIFAGQEQSAYSAEQLANPAQAILPSSTNPLGKALATNPLQQSNATQINSIVSDYGQKVALAENGAITAYQKVASLQPGNANAQFQLAQAAQTIGDNTAAVAAYKRYLKLNPDSSTAAAVRSLIKQLTKK